MRSPTYSVFGFTLIELIVVLGISSLLLGIFASDFTSILGRLRLDSSAHDIASGLRQCRNLAIVYGETNLFELDVIQNKYKLGRDGHWKYLPKNIALTLYTTSEDVSSDSMGRIQFFSDGSTNGGRVTLSLDKLERKIDVNWLTGEVITSRAN